MDGQMEARKREPADTPTENEKIDEMK